MTITSLFHWIPGLFPGKLPYAGLLRTLSTLLIAITVTGCATNYKTDMNLIKNFKEPSVPADKTGVYVIRGNNFTGAARGLWVAVDDAVVADLSNSSHVYLELDGGLNSLHFVQGTAGFGYQAIDNKPGEVVYAKFGYATTATTELLDPDLGKTIVMKTTEKQPLTTKRRNDAYDNLLINPGVLGYPIMAASKETLTADADSAVVRFYRPGKLIAQVAFDIWNQDGYVGSTTGGNYFSVKLKPGHHIFLSRSERYSVLDANLEAGKEYAVELSVGMGWNQAHIKLLPIDLNDSAASRKVDSWKSKLKSQQMDQDQLSSDVLAGRIQRGHEYLETQRTAIASGDEPKRDLPASFGM